MKTILDETGQPPKLKILIAVPTRGLCSSMWAMDLASLYAHSTMALVTNDFADIGMSFTPGTYIASNRQDLADNALRQGATHIFWLDDDMRFPKDALLRLLKHNRQVVGVNYPTRKSPVMPTAIKTFGLEEDEPSTRLQFDDDATGLEEVDGIGFGCILTRTDIFRALTPPYFENYWRPDLVRWVGEDIDFCYKLKEAGIPVYVDHDLSRDISHVGEFEYRWQHAAAWAEEFDEWGNPRSDDAETPDEEPIHSG